MWSKSCQVWKSRTSESTKSQMTPKMYKRDRERTFWPLQLPLLLGKTSGGYSEHVTRNKWEHNTTNDPKMYKRERETTFWPLQLPLLLGKTSGGYSEHVTRNKWEHKITDDPKMYKRERWTNTTHACQALAQIYKASGIPTCSGPKPRFWCK